MPTTPKMDYALGLDLGGTNIKAAIVSLDGEVLDQLNVDTPTERGVTETVEAIVDVINKMNLSWPDFAGIGLGSPGLVDINRRTIRLSPNFPNWRDVPLKDIIESEISRPVYLENDVNCFALAEQRWGASKGYKHVVALALGTGIGGALILDGKLYRGSSGAAGELGHISVDLWGPKCACGNFGCVERYIGRQYFVDAAREALDDDTIESPKQVSDLAENGDKRALEFIVGRGEILGAACTSLLHALDPEAIIIGGGVAQCGEPLFQGIRQSIKLRAYSVLRKKLKILPAKLGTIAGAMGAAALGFEAGEQS